MDKKTAYFIIAAVIIIVVIVVIVMMQKPTEPGQPPVIETPKPAETKVKTETEVIRDIAKKMNLAEGQLPLRITTEDNGHFFSLTPGKSLVLMLGNDYEWQISSSDEKVLAKRNIDAGDPRVQAIYQVAQAGDAVLSASGTCKNQSVCAGQSQAFTFNVQGIVSEVVPPDNLVK
jgi:hypothetical protein